jgi:nitroreductase
MQIDIRRGITGRNAACREVGVMQLNDVIFGRRSVRDFADEPVSKAIVRSLIQAAIQAPSAVNSQPWAFVVVQDKVLLKRYSDRAKILCARIFEAASTHKELMEKLSDPSFNIFYNSGTLIVVCAKPAGQHPDWDCCLAAQNLMLAAHDKGLGTCPIGLAWPLFEQPDVKKELNLPADYVAVMPIIVGYPRAAVPPVARKEPEIRCWK